MMKRLVPGSIKGKVILGVVGVLAVLAAWQIGRAWWLHGYQTGTRSGIVRRVAKKGSPLCRFWVGELVINNTTLTAPPEIWEFNIDSDVDTSALVTEVQRAEASGQRTTLQYRQDKGKWWACSRIEYYVTGVTKGG